MTNYDWEKMTPLEEVYAIRKRIAEKFGYSLDAIFDAGRANSCRRKGKSLPALTRRGMYNHL